MNIVAARPGDAELVERLRSEHGSWLTGERPSVRAVRSALGGCRADKAQRIMTLLFEGGTPAPVRVNGTAVRGTPKPVRVPDPGTPVRDVPRTGGTDDTVPLPVIADPVRVPPVRGTPETPVRKWAYRIEESFGIVPPLAALIVAAVLQTMLAHDKLHWDYWYAWLPAAAIEGGAVYIAALRDRHLVEGDSTTILSAGLFGFVSISCALVAYHVYETQAPMQVAGAMGVMAGLSAFLWGRRSAWKKRVALRARGLLRARPMADAPPPQFSAHRWVWSPVETVRAFRYAIKFSISDPEQAIEAYRARKDS